ncbi:hypothetical protein I316_02108 [Kwoniella heveanensis BCC8398]|uniref:5-oxoprolinase (ATP-hydrolysing) n=1 Tax=Kwoniella heveanensis BCC8398 TaxID=1296120 RepID=A0A1B9GZ05_9TREE|nr:hypothetical protein I316_02108 [Kwoniella heveanensis BCC8398]
MTLITKRQAAGIRIAVDRGGTFCDVYATFKNKAPVILKVLSVDAAYPDAPTEAIRRVLEIGYEETIPRGQPLDVSGVEVIRMGTTVATNALLERKGERTAFITTRGFKDVLKIGNQSRPNLFDLSVRKPGMLYEAVVEVDERVVLANGYQVEGVPVLTGTTGEKVQVVKAPDLNEVRKDLQRLHDQGMRSLSVALLHSYTFPDHEDLIGELAIEVGFTHVSLSSRLSPMVKIVPRAHSATADAYLTPELKRYLQGFEKSFTNLRPGMVQFMQSDGGLVDASNFSGLHAILSGPAGGVVGYASTCFDPARPVPVIGFDMGGTSTDVSRYDGHFDHIMETTTAGVTIQSPQLDISTVAAGGGSILFWENGLLRVGPESAGAHPGPAAYRKGGPLTVTDANILLGRLLPSHFPHIFGPEENLPLDVDIVRQKFQELAERINVETWSNKSPEDLATGFLQVATEAMCSPIRTLSESHGHDTSSHDLASFGGAGGQAACNVAVALGISRVIIHKSSSILSAFGIALADLVDESQESFSGTTKDEDRFLPRLDELQKQSERSLSHHVDEDSALIAERYLNLRYEGADATIMIREPEDGDWAQAFKAEHHQQFGFSHSDRAVCVEDLRVRVISRSHNAKTTSLGEQIDTAAGSRVPVKPSEKASVYFDSTGWTSVSVYDLLTLPIGATIPGPAMIVDNTSTLVVVPAAEALITSDSVVINLEKVDRSAEATENIDPVQLSIFGHRFMAISEQMGHALQKTAVSVNIKERLDFSCALFDPDGKLVANAPHVPAMLGSMQSAVRWQADHWRGQLKPGDVLLSNHPIAGGVHLPDFTIVTPVFDEAGKEVIFYTASRGHHADVGGIAPGSMPPQSRTIFDEGASIVSFKVVSGGVFDEAGLIRLLVDEPAKHSFGTRTLSDNISDVHAQISATVRGVSLVHDLVKQHTLPVVHSYMRAIQRTAAAAVRELLKGFARKHAGKPLTAMERMDDGTPINLNITIDADTGDATFDFTGTGPEVYGNWNAPPAICNSAVIYSLRCLLASDIPLNQGCLEPIKIIIPDGTLLRPSMNAAVCGGNVLTSQRITDVVLKAFEACAASNGCMANLTFGYDEGEDSLGFYETIAGGAGAGPTWEGTSGTQTHMTNTRITDPEIMERRYPVILRQFTLRTDSAGDGQHRGGEGVIRELEFRRPVACSILSERRVYQPYGMHGGQPAALGLNLWKSKDENGNETVVNMGGKNTVPMKAGDRVMIMTPGGGGYGAVGKTPEVANAKQAAFAANGGATLRKEQQHTN